MFFSQEQYDEYERDLQGDGYQNEYARASAADLIARGGIPNEKARAHALTLSGKFVVLHYWPFYCRVTDAILGEGVTIEQVCDTEAQALATIAEAQEARGEDCESYSALYRITAVQKPAAQAVPDFDDEVPF